MDPVRCALAEQLKKDEKIRFLAVILRVARANEVSALERDRLQPIAEWIGVGPQEQAEAVRRADDLTLSLRELVDGLQHGDQGLLLFRECCAVVWVDLTRSAEEEELIDRLARVLGIDDGTRAVLDSPLASSPEGERRFLTLLGGTYSPRNEG